MGVKERAGLTKAYQFIVIEIDRNTTIYYNIYSTKHTFSTSRLVRHQPETTRGSLLETTIGYRRDKQQGYPVDTKYADRHIIRYDDVPIQRCANNAHYKVFKLRHTPSSKYFSAFLNLKQLWSISKMQLSQLEGETNLLILGEQGQGQMLYHRILSQ